MQAEDGVADIYKSYKKLQLLMRDNRALLQQRVMCLENEVELLRDTLRDRDVELSNAARPCCPSSTPSVCFKLFDTGAVSTLLDKSVNVFSVVLVFVDRRTKAEHYVRVSK